MQVEDAEYGGGALLFGPENSSSGHVTPNSRDRPADCEARQKKKNKKMVRLAPCRLCGPPEKKNKNRRGRKDSNLRGQSPHDF